MSVLDLDNRGLPPPEPMVRILAALKDLEGGVRLRVLMDREPFPLYPELERRGFSWDFGEEAGEFTLTIWRTP